MKSKDYYFFGLLLDIWQPVYNLKITRVENSMSGDEHAESCKKSMLVGLTSGDSGGCQNVDVCICMWLALCNYSILEYILIAICNYRKLITL